MDEAIDTIKACSRGKALGPDSIPIELLMRGGLPAAGFLHCLIVACWLQGEAPIGWKGSRLLNIPRAGGIPAERDGFRGMMINDQMVAVNG